MTTIQPESETKKPLPWNQEDLIPIETGLEKPEKQLEMAAFGVVSARVQELVKDLIRPMADYKVAVTDTSSVDVKLPETLPQEWEKYFYDLMPTIDALLQLAQEPKTQHRVENFQQLVRNAKAERGPVSGFTPLEAKPGLPTTE